jgi:hypothetical protein
MTTTPPQANGHARSVTLAPLRLPEHGPARPWPQQDDPGRSRAADKPGRWPSIDGDTAIRVLAAIVVLAVAAFAAIVSYSHIFELGHHHGQDGAAARLLPLSVDGLIASASLVMLHAARRELPVPWLARAMLALGVGATVAANVGYGLPFGWLSAVVSAWPAVAFVGSVEMAVRFVRDARHDAAPDDAIDDGGGDGDDDGRPPPPEPSPSPSRSRQRGPSGKAARALAVIKRNPGLNDAQVAAKAGVSESTARRARAGMKGAVT